MFTHPQTALRMSKNDKFEEKNIIRYLSSG
jgi:hypothetical protein